MKNTSKITLSNGDRFIVAMSARECVEQITDHGIWEVEVENPQKRVVFLNPAHITSIEDRDR